MRFLVLFLSVVFLFGNEKAIIQLNWKYQFEFAGFIMAKEKGFYKDVGVDVTLKEVQKNVDIVKFVLDNRNSFGVGNSSLISLQAIGGKNLKLLMPIYDESLYVLTAVNTDIKNLSDIKKYHIILDQFAIKNPAILAMLKSENININDLKIKKENFYTNIRQSGIFAFYKSNEIYFLDKNKIKYKIFDPKDYGFDLYGDILFTSEYTSLNNPDFVNKVTQATKRGFIYAFNHIDETINVILKKYNTQNLTKDRLLFEANILKSYLSKSFKFDDKKISKIENMYILLLF